MNAPTVITVTADEKDAGARLDKVLTSHVEGLSRSRLQQLIEQGHVTSGQYKSIGASQKIKPGDTFTITIPEAEPATPQAQDIPLDIVFEDKDMLVINKPVGLVVHPAAGNFDGTLVNALLAHCGDELSGIGGVKRPGIVHRLDKDTSGLMLAAKNDMAHAKLSEQLSSRTLKRTYQALVWGVPTPVKGIIRGNIGRSKANRKKMAIHASGGREAVTEYTVLKNFAMKASLVECRLQTGRTHQIRVHMAHIGHGVIGDPLYGGGGKKSLKIDFPRQALHAVGIEFIHPRTGEKMAFASKLPKDMDDLARDLENL